MVKPLIYKRNEKGSALTFTEVDTSLQNLRDSTISIAVPGSDTVVNDLNDTTTLVALDGISITGEGSTQTIGFDASLVNDLTPQLGGDLDAQNQNITDLSGIDFNTVTEQDHTAGRIYWDPVDGTLAVGMEYDEVVARVGHNLYYHVKNQSGVTIYKGDAVMAVGTIGASGQITCALAVADGSVNARYMLGIAAMDMIDGADGYVLQFGRLKGVDTQGSSALDWSDGTVLWLDPLVAGGLTDQEPTAPNLKIAIAYVVDAGANGTMFVRANTGYNLSDLHDVNPQGVQDGDVLTYNGSTGTWVPGQGGSGATYTISADSTSLGDAFLALTGSDLTVDSVRFNAGAGIEITVDDPSTITFTQKFATWDSLGSLTWDDLG